MLAHVPGEAREQALDLFYHRHAAEALVIDKWFVLQATIPEAGTLARVKKTDGAQRPFRSPIPIACARSSAPSPPAIRRSSMPPREAATNFVAEIVIGLDHTNPQVAARLLAAFKSWRALESKRRGLAEAALRRVAEVNDLSADVKDIVERSLA